MSDQDLGFEGGGNLRPQGGGRRRRGLRPPARLDHESRSVADVVPTLQRPLLRLSVLRGRVAVPTLRLGSRGSQGGPRLIHGLRGGWGPRPGVGGGHNADAAKSNRGQPSRQ